MDATTFASVGTSISSLTEAAVLPLGLAAVGVVVAAAGIKLAIRMARGV